MKKDSALYQLMGIRMNGITNGDGNTRRSSEGLMNILAACTTIRLSRHFTRNTCQTFPTYTFSRYLPAVLARRYSSSTSVASLSRMRYRGKKRVI